MYTVHCTCIIYNNVKGRKYNFNFIVIIIIITIVIEQFQLVIITGILMVFELGLVPIVYN